MKTTNTPIENAKKILFALLFVVSNASSQNFDLLSAKSSDKVAQSKFFEIDSNKILNTYEMFAFSSPSAHTSDSIFVIAGMHNATSSAKSPDFSTVKDFALQQNYPNPFNPSTTIGYTVGKRAKVSVVLFDITGKKIATLVNEHKEAGSYSVHWNGTTDSGSSAASGTYLYRLIATSDNGNSTIDTKKLALLK